MFWKNFLQFHCSPTNRWIKYKSTANTGSISVNTTTWNRSTCNTSIWTSWGAWGSTRTQASTNSFKRPHQQNLILVYYSSEHPLLPDGWRKGHYLKLTISGYLTPCLQQTRREKQSWTLAGDRYVNNIAVYLSSYLFFILFNAISEGLLWGLQSPKVA